VSTSLPVIVDRSAPSCKHFTGLRKDRCKAGVLYESVRKDHDPIQYAYSAKARPPHYTSVRSFPCLGEYNVGGATCDKLELPTAEEIAAEEAEFAAMMDDTNAARKAIVAHLGGPWKKGMASSQGVIDCPVCKAEKALRFSRAGYNGHIHAACRTADCVSWME
jgi:hypothetical protein